MPSDVDGRPRYLRVPGPEMDPVLDAWDAAQLDESGALLLGAFFTGYWGMAEPAEVGEIQRISLRLPGEVG
jgi:hypothetical protein